MAYQFIKFCQTIPPKKFYGTHYLTSPVIRILVLKNPAHTKSNRSNILFEKAQIYKLCPLFCFKNTNVLISAVFCGKVHNKQVLEKFPIFTTEPL